MKSPELKPLGKDEYRWNGKQVLLNGEHYADAINDEAAQSIAYAMNSVFLSKLPPFKMHVRDPICQTCKQVGMHASTCPEGRT